jgi:hypothetical protein
MNDEKDGMYCKVCGGIIPQNTSIKPIIVDGKITGINQLDFIIDEVARLELTSDYDIKNELVKRAQVLNYIPTKMTEKYADGLFLAFKERCKDRR